MKLLLLFFIFTTMIFADRDGGPYLGIGYGVSTFNDDDLYINIKEDSSKTSILYAGAYINKYLSVELNYINFSNQFVIQNNQDVENASFYAFSVDTLAHYPILKDNLDFYLKFGAGNIHKNGISDDGYTMVYGVGSAYRYSNYLAFKIAYENYQFGFDSSGDNISDYKMYLAYTYFAMEVQF